MVTSRLSADRARTAAVLVGVIALGYALLSIFYFYADWFKFVDPGETLLQRVEVMGRRAEVTTAGA